MMEPTILYLKIIYLVFVKIIYFIVNNGMYTEQKFSY